MSKLDSRTILTKVPLALVSWFRRLTCVGLLFFALSCSKPPSVAPVLESKVSKTDLEIVAIMQGYHVLPFSKITSDLNYALPEEAWVKGKFIDLLRAFQFTLKQTHYAAESNDCDDFAKMAAAFARLVHSNDKNKPKGTAIAIGEFYYKVDGGGNHAINFAVARAADGRPTLVFFDPQTWAVLRLSQVEISSCANWIL